MWSDLSSPWTLRTSWVFQTWKSSPSPSSWSSSELELSTWEGTTQDCWLHRKTWYFQGGKTHFTSHAFVTNSTNLGLQAATCCCDIWKIQVADGVTIGRHGKLITLMESPVSIADEFTRNFQLTAYLLAERGWNHTKISWFGHVSWLEGLIPWIWQHQHL